MMEMKYDIYISYRRDDGWQYAATLQGMLSQREYRTYFQVDRWSTGRCDDETFKTIKSSSLFVLLLTPGYIEGLSNAYHYVYEEVSFAIKERKKIISIVPDEYMGMCWQLPLNCFEAFKDINKDPFVMRFNGRVVSVDSVDELIEKRIIPIIGVPKSGITGGKLSFWKSIQSLFSSSEHVDLLDSYHPEDKKDEDRVIYDIFISYRRIDGRDHARNIQLALKAAGYKRIFFDYESLQKGEFTKRIIDAIYSCKDFILVLSPKSMKRCKNDGDPVANEIRAASRYKKNIIPVTIDNKSVKWPRSFPQDLEFIKGLQFHDHKTDSYFDSSIEDLCTKLKTKLEQE